MIHREGKSILIYMFAFWAVINLFTFQFVDSQWIFFIVLFVSLVSYILVTQFFRNPKRKAKSPRKDQIYSPVDGKVVVIEEVYEEEHLDCGMRQISVFMSPTNVHVTRYPISGEVVYSKYHPGKYLVAWHPKSSTENERTTVVIRNPIMGSILYRQIAGAMARRIVNYAMVGQKVKVGEDSGFIKFGSRVDVLVPLNYKICVHLGQKVRGGETVLAEKVQKKL